MWFARTFDAMDTLSQWLEKNWVQNTLVWIFILLVSIMITEGPWVVKVCVVAFVSLPIYTNNLKIQVYFYRKNKAKWLILFLLNILFFSGVATTVISFLLGEFSFKLLSTILGFLVLIVSSGGALKMAKDGFVRRQQIKHAELNLLKAQMTPHFLFNTLNNLYGLSLSKSDKLPDLMLKLSDLLRYSLYETHQHSVPLEKEVNYLQNYIELEKIRLEETVNIAFEVRNTAASFRIAPMLLLTFVENAFKHMATKARGEAFVNLSIGIENKQLTFSCVNSINATKRDTHVPADLGGLGLVNTKKQLDFIYGDEAILLVEQETNEFRIELKLPEL